MASRAAQTKKMRFSRARGRKEGRKDEKTEGLGQQDAVTLKFMEAFEFGERGKQKDEKCSGR